MFPHVSGFHWSPAHIVFLAAFFCVITVVASTVVLALWRTVRDLRTKSAARIQWLSDFHDLPEEDRVCRHAVTGELHDRTCDKFFDCRVCETHASRVAGHPVAAAAGESPFGLPYPGDRYYHRGHAWARPEPDGTLTVGLDEFGTRLFGRPESVALPVPGTQLEANAPAWTMKRNHVEIRILSPVDGEVIETGVPGQDRYYLRVKPASADFRHLLRGAEIMPWLRRELERVEILLSPTSTGPSLADGGVLMDDLPDACPKADWDAVWSRVFLDP